MGDMNAKQGSDNTGKDKVMGKWENNLERINENGEIFIQGQCS